MLTGAAAGAGPEIAARIAATAVLLERRGFATTARRLAGSCLGGPVAESQVLAALAPATDLVLDRDLILTPSALPRAETIRRRADGHRLAAAAYLPATLRFIQVLGRLPFILSVSIAGSMATGGFALSDDVDLNLIVEDGSRHLAYFALNVLAYLHALRHRGKPVDVHSRRPLAPRLMTANLILERSDCFPLARLDADMALELLIAEPVLGADLYLQVLAANPELSGHFPQLARKPAPLSAGRPRPLPARLFPSWLERPAAIAGRWGWRYMQWTRRARPQALARVAFVRQTMQPYTLFPDS